MQRTKGTSMLTLKDYQAKHVKNLGEKIYDTLNEKSEDAYNAIKTEKVRFLLESPTGSGKTLMLSEIIRKYLKNAVVLVLSPGAGNLQEQTRNSITRNLEGTGIQVFDVNESTIATPATFGSVFVKNWESLVSKDKKTGKYKTILSKTNERYNIFDWLEETVKDVAVPLAIIIDEAHYGNSKDASQIDAFLEDIDRTVRSVAGYSPIVIEATATPNEKKRNDGIVHVDEKVRYSEVKRAELMRKAVILNDGDDFDVNSYQNVDIENILLELAYRRLEELDRLYVAAGSQYHGLIGIQIPNSNLGRECKERVKAFFKSKGITEDSGELFEYSNDNKTGRLDELNTPKSPARVLIYKQAIVMGWDCPRAQILVGFRHIKSKTFSIQNLGRFLRTTEAKYYTGSNPEIDKLNYTYVYTNEQGADIENEEIISSGNVEVLTKLEQNADAKEIISLYNGLHLPTSVVKTSNGAKIMEKPLVQALTEHAERWSPNFVHKTLAGERLASGEYSIDSLDTDRSQLLQSNSSSKEFRKTDSEVGALFYQFVSDAIRYNGHQDIQQFSAVARNLVPRLLGLPQIQEFFSGNQVDKERGLLVEENKAELRDFINEFLTDHLFSNTDVATPVSSSRIVRTGTHNLSDTISVSKNGELTSGDRAGFCLYTGKDSNGGIISYSTDSKGKSQPENDFENHCLNLKYIERIADANGIPKNHAIISDRFELAFFHKNPSFASEDAFSIGIQFNIVYNKGGKQMRSSFFPDYLIFVRDRNTGNVFPVIAEIKSTNGGQNDDEELEAKRKAAESYMNHTGVPFLVVYPNSTGTEFFKYDTKTPKSLAGNTSFASFLNNVDQSNIQPVKDNADLSWMYTLGQ
jgi:superfamily II DNA or RNA helicase